jgi:hypothetical protein
MIGRPEFKRQKRCLKLSGAKSDPMVALGYELSMKDDRAGPSSAMAGPGDYLARFGGQRRAVSCSR